MYCYIQEYVVFTSSTSQPCLSLCVTLGIFLTRWFKVLEVIWFYRCVVSFQISFWHQLSSPSGDPLMILPWHLISAALLVALVIASVVCTCNYVRGGKEKSMPQGLVRLFFLQCSLACPGCDEKMLRHWKVRPFGKLITVQTFTVFMWHRRLKVISDTEALWDVVLVKWKNAAVTMLSAFSDDKCSAALFFFVSCSFV